MTNEIEAVGDVISGGLLARAIEPTSGAATVGQDHVCLNCGLILTGPYCAACGQRAHIHRTLSAFGHDLIHALLHFEGKGWRTFPLLIVWPGELTRRYVHGQRARFVSPLALFLICTFLMFSSISLFGATSSFDSATDKRAKAMTKPQIEAEIARDKSAIASLKQQRVAADEARGEKIDRQLEKLNDDITDLQTSDVMNVSAGGTHFFVKSRWGDKKFTGNQKFDRLLNERMKTANDNPELLLMRMEQNSHKFSWLIIPFSVPFMWLIFFWKRQNLLYDHAVFVTYSLCFMTLLLSFSSVISGLGMVTLSSSMLAIAPPIHMFRQLKGAYLLSNRSATWRTGVLLVVALFVLALFAVLMVLFGLLGS